MEAKVKRYRRMSDKMIQHMLLFRSAFNKIPLNCQIQLTFPIRSHQNVAWFALVLIIFVYCASKHHTYGKKVEIPLSHSIANWIDSMKINLNSRWKLFDVHAQAWQIEQERERQREAKGEIAKSINRYALSHILFNTLFHRNLGTEWITSKI